MQGMVQVVYTVPGGDSPIQEHYVGESIIRLDDASPFDPLGGFLTVEDEQLAYTWVDLDEDTIQLAEPLTFGISDESFVSTVPPTETTYVAIALGDEVVEDIEVPHHLKPMLPEGLREPDAAEAVLIEEVSIGRFVLTDVVGIPTAIAGEYVENVDRALLESRRALGDKLAENDAAIAAAQGSLSEVNQQISDAFEQIDLKPDEAYVDAAKQQAIDAALVDAASLSGAGGNMVQNSILVGFDSSTDTLPGWTLEGDWLLSTRPTGKGILPTTSATSATSAPLVISEGDVLAFGAHCQTLGSNLAVSLVLEVSPDGSDWTVAASVRPTEATVSEPVQLREEYEVGSGIAWARIVIAIDSGGMEGYNIFFAPFVRDITDATEAEASAIAEAQARADAAEAAAISAASAYTDAAAADAASALSSAQQDLEAAIASGDADAIADAEAKIATAKAEAIAAAEADATAKAGEAMTKANAALTAAQSAQATADNAIRTYYSEDPPWDNGTTQPDEVLGDMWYKDSTGQAYRWNGSAWRVIQDASIGEALAAAQDAQTTADGKITAFYQPNEPLEGDEGDLWFDTDNNSKIYRRTGGQWLALLDAAALADAARAAAEQAAAADATAKAEAAEAAAAQAAATDATAKANQAKADAEAAAQAYADQVAAGEGSGALAAAKEYAEGKAEEARQAAEAAAALDATAKAEQAEAAAAATAAADATAKADAARDAALLEAAATEQRALSRGTDLVTNGTGYLGSNYNFSSFTFDPSDAPIGAAGSFAFEGSVYGIWADEPIPVSGSKKYRYSFAVRQQVEGIQSRFYGAILPIDGAGSGISPTHYMYEAGTTTTLAQPLNVGDTEVHLTDGGANFYGSPGKPAGTAVHRRRIIWWDYTDPFGKTWEPETYSRNGTTHDSWADGAIVGNVITLREPYGGPAKPAGTYLSNGSSGGSYIYTAPNRIAQQEWTTYGDSIDGAMEQGEPNSGRSVAQMSTGLPPGTASIRVGWLPNRNEPGGRQAFANVSFSDASAAQRTADEAKADAADAYDRAEDAEDNAKAYTVTMTDGLAKGVESTAMPGTTVMPKDSVWRVVDSSGNYSAVFVQQTDPTGNDWQARAITSDVVDNLDVGKLTASEGTINELVANAFAAKLANLIEANIGNLTVTGDAHLNSVVAEQIAGDVAAFVKITADQILAGSLQAALNISAGGSITAGDPAGRAAELHDDGLSFYDVSPDGDRYPSTVLGGPEADQLLLLDAVGDVVSGFDNEGGIVGTSLSISEDATVGGIPMLGSLLDPTVDNGWLDGLARGLVARASFLMDRDQRAAFEEWGHGIITFTALAGRAYKISSFMQIQTGGSSTSNAGGVRGRHRVSLGGDPTINSDILDETTVEGSRQAMAVTTQIFSYVQYETDQEVSILYTYEGIDGNPTMLGGYMYVEDVGPALESSGGTYSTGRESTPPPRTKQYTSVWSASNSEAFNGSGGVRADNDNDLVQGYSPYAPMHGASQSVAMFYGTADRGETGKTIDDALNGATVDKVEVWFYFTHWHYGSGGTARLGKLGERSIPSNLNANPSKDVKNWQRGAGKWVRVPTNWFSDSGNRGVTIGGGSSQAPIYYGRAVGHQGSDYRKPKVRITYTR